MARNWGEVEIDIPALAECAASLAVAGETLANVIQAMKDAKITLLHMENVVSLQNAARAAMSSSRKAEDALKKAVKMQELVEAAKKRAAKLKG